MEQIKGKRLTEDQLLQVSGGFKQIIPQAFSYGEVIRYPRCGNENGDEFYCEIDAELKKDLYTCAVCGQAFMAAAGYGITDIL